MVLQDEHFFFFSVKEVRFSCFVQNNWIHRYDTHKLFYKLQDPERLLLETCRCNLCEFIQGQSGHHELSEMFMCNTLLLLLKVKCTCRPKDTVESVTVELSSVLNWNHNFSSIIA